MHGEAVIGGLVAFSLLKKVTAYGVARYYGFPKLYRKIAKATLRIAPTRQDAARSNEMVKTVFRVPNRVFAAVRQWRGERPPAESTVQAARSPLSRKTTTTQ